MKLSRSLTVFRFPNNPQVIYSFFKKFCFSVTCTTPKGYSYCAGMFIFLIFIYYCFHFLCWQNEKFNFKCCLICSLYDQTELNKISFCYFLIFCLFFAFFVFFPPTMALAGGGKCVSANKRSKQKQGEQLLQTLTNYFATPCGWLLNTRSRKF